MDEHISDILWWTPSHNRASNGQTGKTYQQQLCADTFYCLEDQQEAIYDRDGGREGVREIRASSLTWWFS